MANNKQTAPKQGDSGNRLENLTIVAASTNVPPKIEVPCLKETAQVSFFPCATPNPRILIIIKN